MTTTAKAFKGPPMEGAIARWYARNTKGDIRGFRVCADAIKRFGVGVSQRTKVNLRHLLGFLAGPQHAARCLFKFVDHVAVEINAWQHTPHRRCA